MKTLNAVAEKPACLNGINVQAALDTIGAIKADKGLGRFVFRARNRWIGGMVSQSAIRDFYGAGREDTSREEAFEYVAGEPPVLLANNEGANAGEYLLHALAACVTTTFVLHATARGITVRELSTQIEGDADLQGVLGLDESVGVAFQRIRMRIDVKADCSDEALNDLIAYAQAHSPVFNSISKPVPIAVERVHN